jgi:hypothetical protein
MLRQWSNGDAMRSCAESCGMGKSGEDFSGPVALYVEAQKAAAAGCVNELPGLVQRH